MKCKCGRKLIRYPVYKGQEEGEKFSWDKVIWLNLFKVDPFMVMMIALLLFSAWAYGHDIQQYQDIREEPLQFCIDVKCEDFLFQPQEQQEFDTSMFNFSTIG